MNTLTEDLLDHAIGAARKLMPEADQDAQAEFAARLLVKLPARISLGVVQMRRHRESWDWITVQEIDAEAVPVLNQTYGWEKFRTVEIGVCP